MKQFCEGQFWNSNLIYDQNIIILSNCFKYLVFSLIPCFYIFIFSIYELNIIKNVKKKKASWTILIILKIIFITLLILVKITELVYLFIEKNQDKLFLQFISPIIEIISFIIIIILTFEHKNKSIYTSGIIFIFWLIFAIFDVTSFVLDLFNIYNEEIILDDFQTDTFFIFKVLHVSFVISSLILNCFSDYKFNRDESLKKCPINRVSFLSKITFSYFNSLAWKGFKKPLEEKDLWDLDKEYVCKFVFGKFEQNQLLTNEKLNKKKKIKPEFNLEKSDCKRNKNNSKNVNIVLSIAKNFKCEFVKAFFLKLVGSLMTFANPILLNILITFVSSNKPIWQGYACAFGMFFASMLESIFLNQFEFYIYTIAIKIKSTLILAIYKKSLNLSAKSKKNFTSGQVMNLMSIDAQRIVEFIVIFNTIWSSLLQILISIYLLWFQLGYATFSGVGIIIILIPLNGFISKYLEINQNKLMKYKDKRIKCLNEVLNSIKVIKLYAWENSFFQKIKEIRNQELACLKSIMIFFSLVIFSLNTTPFLVSLFSFLTFILINENQIFNANKIFVSLTLFNIIRVPLGMVPFFVNIGVTCLVSIKRINKYFSGEDINQNIIEKNDLGDDAIIFKNACFAWDSDSNITLHNLNFSIKKNKLTAIIGTVGSGKSSLFLAMLGDMHKLSGTVNVSGSIAYVSQQAWIQNNTLRNNILFFQTYNKAKYDEIIEKTQLLQDIKIFIDGDQVEIGDKGINLSGGQKQRINIARAVYSEKDIYLFDDPLSALDSYVGEEIFEKILSDRGLLKNKTRILVTHKLSILSKVDYIIVMKDGKISEQGTYNELLNKKEDFSELIYQFSNNNEDFKEKDVLTNQTQLKLEKKNLLLKLENSSISELSVKSEHDKIIEDQQKMQSLKLKTKSYKTKKEYVETGSVKFSVYFKYLKTLGLRYYILTIVFYIISHSFNIIQSLWLSEWSNDSLDINKFNDTVLRKKRLLGYFGFGMVETVFIFFATFTLSLSCLRAAKKIHNRMLTRIFLVPLSFFDKTPIGRLINRFTKDIDLIDFGINMDVRGVIIYVFRVLVVFIIIIYQTPYFFIVLAIFVLVYLILQKIYISTSRQLKRLESITRSPIYSHFHETICGAQCIRAYNFLDKFIEECCDRVDINIKIYFANQIAIRWLTLRLEFLSYTIIFLTALFSIILKDTLNPGLVGITISSALNITNTLNTLIKSVSDLENDIVCVERCLEYTDLEHEKPMYIPENKPQNEWPNKGVIDFRNYSTKYRNDLNLVLDNVSFKINENEKIAVVGRTGAGKSSLTLALFRIIEAVSGNIFIDEIDIGKLGLYDLRSRLNIIPQDPFLFSGTLRTNLDPLENYQDNELWKVLEQAHLKNFANENSGLDCLILENGENISIGQGQLICLARALLRKKKILILDEATSAIDLETDELIQKTIRREFMNCTIITIAHRINTIVDYDRILVLDKGKIVEFDSPKKLLNNEKSYFYSMAKKSGLI